MFRINPFKNPREDNFVPNKQVKASVRTKPITVSQPHIFTKKDVNSNSNGLSSIGVESTAKTRRPQPKSNTKNDTVPSTYKSSYIKNKELEVEEHHRNLLLSKKQKHMSFKLEAARTMLIFSCAPLFSWAKAIATACYTQNCTLIHQRFNKTPYDLINDRKLDISFLYVFKALCYPKNDRDNIRKLGVKGDIGFFIGYSTTSCAYRVYNRRTRKVMEMMNVIFDELLTIDFEQSSSKPDLSRNDF
ncbi:retrovirus-related pol polyprotein from transposon TNT 1-94 [Tanacetum coccineum]